MARSARISRGAVIKANTKDLALVCIVVGTMLVLFLSAMEQRVATGRMQSRSLRGGATLVLFLYLLAGTWLPGLVLWAAGTLLLVRNWRERSGGDPALDVTGAGLAHVRRTYYGLGIGLGSRQRRSWR